MAIVGLYVLERQRCTTKEEPASTAVVDYCICMWCLGKVLLFTAHMRTKSRPQVVYIGLMTRFIGDGMMSWSIEAVYEDSERRHAAGERAFIVCVSRHPVGMIRCLPIYFRNTPIG